MCQSRITLHSYYFYARAAVLEGKVSEQQSAITSLQGQVTDLEERVSGLESTMYIYLAGGLIAGLAVGTIIVYAIKRKPT